MTTTAQETTTTAGRVCGLGDGEAAAAVPKPAKDASTVGFHSAGARGLAGGEWTSPPVPLPASSAAGSPLPLLRVVTAEEEAAAAVQVELRGLQGRQFCASELATTDAPSVTTPPVVETAPPKGNKMGPLTLKMDVAAALSSVVAHPPRDKKKMKKACGMKTKKPPQSPAAIKALRASAPDVKGAAQEKAQPDLKKPDRPLNAYNIFFRHERARFLLLHDRGGKLEDHPPFNLTLESVRDLLDNNPYAVNRQKRRHRKSHGVISFGRLTSIVSKSWKALDEKSKEPFVVVAAEHKAEYDEAVKSWRRERKRRGLSMQEEHKPGKNCKKAERKGGTEPEKRKEGKRSLEHVTKKSTKKHSPPTGTNRAISDGAAELLDLRPGIRPSLSFPLQDQDARVAYETQRVLQQHDELMLARHHLAACTELEEKLEEQRRRNEKEEDAAMDEELQRELFMRREMEDHRRRHLEAMGRYWAMMGASPPCSHLPHQDQFSPLCADTFHEPGPLMSRGCPSAESEGLFPPPLLGVPPILGHPTQSILSPSRAILLDGDNDDERIRGTDSPGAPRDERKAPLKKRRRLATESGASETSASCSEGSSTPEEPGSPLSVRKLETSATKARLSAPTLCATGPTAAAADPGGTTDALLLLAGAAIGAS